VFLRDETHHAARQDKRVKRGLARTFQINTLFPGLTCSSRSCSRSSSATGSRRVVEAGASYARQADEARALLATLRLEHDARDADRAAAVRPAAARRDRARARDAPEDPAARRARGRHPRRESVEVLGAIARCPRT
jgi:branched-chain amino acid transport system ATP-binding protein